jgi:hypothetical protein
LSDAFAGLTIEDFFPEDGWFSIVAVPGIKIIRCELYEQHGIYFFRLPKCKYRDSDGETETVDVIRFAPTTWSAPSITRWPTYSNPC